MKKLAFLISCILCCSAAACGTAQEPAPAADSSAASADAAVITPLPSTVDINNLTDCTVFVDLEEGGVYVAEDGTVKMDVTVYDYEKFDMVDIAQMKEGDTIVLCGDENVIETLERREDGDIRINGGELDQGGHTLYCKDNTVFVERGYDNYLEGMYAVGKTTLPVAEDFIFTDASIWDSETETILTMTYTKEQLMDPESGIIDRDRFFSGNTSIRIENGEVVSMDRTFTP